MTTLAWPIALRIGCLLRPKDIKREKNAEKTRWQGACLGTKDAIKQLGADDAHTLEETDDILPTLLEGKTHLYSHLGLNGHS